MKFNFFKRKNKDWRYKEYCELEKSFNQLNSELAELAMTFSERSNSQAELVKSCKDFDILRSSDERFENFRKSHLKQIGQIKKQRDKLIKAMRSLSNTENFDLKLKEYKSNQLNKAILNKYRRGEIDLSICDDLLKSRTKEKVKYADNIVFNEKGEILLLKRSELDKSKPGYYTIPGGHVDLGEDCETAAKRELEEEAGIKVKDVYQVGEYEDDKVHIKYYRSDVENVEPVLQEEEIWSYEWVLPKDLKNYQLLFNMGENLQKILNPNLHYITKIKKSFEDGLINERQRDVLLKNVIEKARQHKYIRKEPDGKGGWNYVYEEEKGKEYKIEDIDTDRLLIKQSFLSEGNKRMMFEGFDKQIDKPEWIRSKSPKKVTDLSIDLIPDKNYAYLNRIDSTGKGYGVETLSAVIKELKKRGINKFEGYIESNNIASQNMMKKLGAIESEKRKYGSIWKIESDSNNITKSQHGLI
ncbi:MAG: NUDIX domain-containing protein, partial [Caldisericia bacterium]|nr:NUDIX domain-containing protein [Caldisericia bacterium]